MHRLFGMSLAMAAFFAVAGLANEAAAQTTRLCQSNDERRIFCPMNTRGGVRVIRQISQTACVPGRTYNVRADGIVVRRGCRALFANIGYRPPFPGPGAGVRQIRCESYGQRRVCAFDRRNGVELVQQLGGRRCVRGQTWGVVQGGIWVEGNCRGLFGPRGRV